MTHEETKILHSDLYNLSHNFVERLKMATEPQNKLSLQEMVWVACIMSDLAKTEKDMLKAKHYHAEHPVDTDKKF
jgi:hypothetical protein